MSSLDANALVCFLYLEPEGLKPRYFRPSSDLARWIWSFFQLENYVASTEPSNPIKCKSLLRAPSMPVVVLRMVCVSLFFFLQGAFKSSQERPGKAQPPLSRWGRRWLGCPVDCTLRSPPGKGCDLYMQACHQLKGRATFSF